MDENRKKRYQEKIGNLRKYHNLLKEWFIKSDLSDLNQEGDYKQIFAIFHAVQLNIEVITDLSAMIVKDLKYNPTDNYVNFETLHREKIITNDLFLSLKELNGLRNRIVHDYNGINDEIAWKSISDNLPHIEKFREAVEAWLEKK